MRASVLALLLALAAPAFLARAQEAPASPSLAEPPDAHPVGQYAGVVPGRAANPGHVRRGRNTLVTWPGFQPSADGASRVFVQTSGPVQTEVQRGTGRIVILLRGVHVPRGNERRSLETRFFNTPVLRAWVEPRRRDAALVLELRADVTPQVRTELGGDGFHFVFVEFGAGNFAPVDPPPVAQTPPPSPPAEDGRVVITPRETAPQPDAPRASPQPPSPPRTAPPRRAEPATPVIAPQPRQTYQDDERPPALQGGAPR